MIGYVVAFALGFLFCKILPDLQHRTFAWFMNKFEEILDPAMGEFKAEVLKEVRDLKTRIPELQGTGSCKILEVGVGSGTNFQFYPDGCHLTVVDPNPHFHSYYNTNRQKFPNIKSEEIIVGFGENMDMIADNSMDCVVITLVLCSVKDVAKVLEQVKRVLVPCGKFYFMEHVKDWDESNKKRRFLQEILTRTGLYPALQDGCLLNRETQNEIKSAGFSMLKLEKKYAPNDHPIFWLEAPMVVGCATK